MLDKQLSMRAVLEGASKLAAEVNCVLFHSVEAKIPGDDVITWYCLEDPETADELPNPDLQ